MIFLIKKWPIILLLPIVLFSGCVPEIPFTSEPSQAQNNSPVSAEYVVPEKQGNYFYNALSSAQERKLYDKLLAAIENSEEKYKYGDKFSSETVSLILNLIFCQEPYTGLKCSKYTIDNGTVTFEYAYNKEKIDFLKEQTQKKEKELVEQVSGLSDYDKVKFFHDYIVQNCNYIEDSELGNTPYGVLIEKRGLCEGYAHTFLELCSLSSIKSAVITGEADTEPHMWNMVKIDDIWYYIDLTWDDIDDESYPELILYDYFLVGNDEISKRKIFYTEKYLPKDEIQTNIDFYTQNECYITEYNKKDIFKILKNQYKKAATDNSSFIYLKAENDEVFSYLLENLLDEYQIIDFQSSLNLNIDPRNVKYITNVEARTITFIIRYKTGEN